MTEVLIRRLGNMIDISPDGQSPLDPRIVGVLTPELSYEHKTLLRGHQRFGPDGRGRAVDIETRQMYTIEDGRLVTSYGFYERILRAFQRLGVRTKYIDLTPQKDPLIYQPDWENVNRYVTFRARQEECLRVMTQNDHGLINATMGFGKTFLFEAMCHLYHRAKIGIVVKPKDVASRIVRQLSRTIPDVGQIGGGVKHRGSRVTVYTAGSLHHADGSEDICLADECHLLMTGKAGHEMGRAFRFARCYGFSGTIDGRMDGADAQLEMFFGPEIFTLTYQEAADLGLVVPIHVRWLPIRSSHNPAKDKTGVPKQRWGIWRHELRNRTIANDIRTHYPDPNDQILVLVSHFEHAVNLWQFLPEFSLCYGGEREYSEIEALKRSRMLPEDFRPTTPEIREQMRSAFEAGTLKRVIATDVWATGVDFPQLSVLYRADARESKNLDAQAPGRTSRIHAESGKECGYIVDCLDSFDRSFKRKSETRKSHYAKLGWTQDWPSGRSQIANA